MEILREDNLLKIKSEYNPEFVKGARNLSGKWSPPYWVFDIQVEDLIKDLCLETYGLWEGEVEKVTLLCTANENAWEIRGALTLRGRTIARAFGRDSGARLGDGVVLLEGEFYSSGSAKNWATEVRGGTKFKVLNVPLSIAEKLVENPEWASTIEIENKEEKPVKENNTIEKIKELVLEALQESLSENQVKVLEEVSNLLEKI